MTPINHTPLDDANCLAAGSIRNSAWSGFPGAVSLSASPNAPGPHGPLDSVQSALDAARALVLRAEHLADALLGAVPVPGETAQRSPENGGVLGAMQADAVSTEALLRRGIAAIERIERATS